MKWWMIPIALCILAGAGYAGDAIVAEPEMAQEDALEKQLQQETARLEAMQAELTALINAPLPQEVKSEPATEPAATDIPSEPLPGMEEQYADSAYALGQIEAAKAAYQKLADAEPSKETMAWARMQLGNCDRKMGNFADAITFYEMVANTAPESIWATEAEWWAGHLRWRLLWNEKSNSR